MPDMTARNPARRGSGVADESSLKPSQGHDHAGAFEIVVLYTTPEITAKVIERAAALSAGLNATLKLVAVYVAPYPAELRCPPAMRQHLTARLTELVARTPLDASIHIVASRDRDGGFRQILRPGSAVLLGSPERFWRTREQKLARALNRQGHRVSLIQFD